MPRIEVSHLSMPRIEVPRLSIDDSSSLLMFELYRDAGHENADTGKEKK